MKGETMKRAIWTVVGAVVGLLAAYLGWRMILVPGSQGFGESAYQLRGMMDSLAISRYHEPWWLIGAAGLTGGIAGFVLGKR